MSAPAVIKAGIIATVLGGCLVSCAVAPIYKSATDGERSKLVFTSPNRRDEFLVLDRLALLVYTADRNCLPMLQGRIPVSQTLQTHNMVHVPADKRLYLKVWQRASDPISQSTSQKSSIFSFLPEANHQYEIRHMDNPTTIRVEAYEIGDDGSSRPVELDNWRGCKKS